MNLLEAQTEAGTPGFHTTGEQKKNEKKEFSLPPLLLSPLPTYSRSCLLKAGVVMVTPLPRRRVVVNHQLYHATTFRCTHARREARMEGGGKKKEINVAADKSASWEDNGERRGTTVVFNRSLCLL